MAVRSDVATRLDGVEHSLERVFLTVMKDQDLSTTSRFLADATWPLRPSHYDVAWRTRSGIRFLIWR